MMRVLFSFPHPGDGANPYLSQLVRSLPDGVETGFFSLKSALFGRYDVFHVHWPEYVFRRKTAGSIALTQLLSAALLLKLRLARTPIVRTLHNLAPHDAGNAFERLLHRWMDAQTARWIRLNPLTPTRDAARTDTILHGHYRDVCAAHPRIESQRGRLLFFGQVRAYKGLETLIDAFAGIDDATLKLRIAGKPVDAGIDATLQQAAQRDARVELELRHLDDAELSEEIARAEIVVLPYPQMHNSGALLLALSLDRPMIAPDNDVNRGIAAEVGDGWLHLYAAPLDAQKLAACIAAARTATRASRPDLSRREWRDAGAQHLACYQHALAER